MGLLEMRLTGRAGTLGCMGSAGKRAGLTIGALALAAGVVGVVQLATGGDEEAELRTITPVDDVNNVTVTKDTAAVAESTTTTAAVSPATTSDGPTTTQTEPPPTTANETTTTTVASTTTSSLPPGYETPPDDKFAPTTTTEPSATTTSSLPPYDPA